MFEVAAREFGVSLEINFPKGRSLFSAKDSLQAFIEQYALNFTPPRGSPREIRVNQEAAPFEYAVTAPLFGRPSALRIDAYGITASIDGGRSEHDAQLIAECMQKVIEIGAPPADSKFIASAYVHGTCAPGAFEHLFTRSFEGTRFEEFGIHGNVTVTGWPYPVSVLREPSKKLTKGVFVRWQSEFSPTGSVAELRTAFAAAGKAIQLEVSTLADP